MDHFIDGDSAIVVSNVSVEGFCHALREALALSAGHFQNMKKADRVLAEQLDGSRL